MVDAATPEHALARAGHRLWFGRLVPWLGNGCPTPPPIAIWPPPPSTSRTPRASDRWSNEAGFDDVHVSTDDARSHRPALGDATDDHRRHDRIAWWHAPVHRPSARRRVVGWQRRELRLLARWRGLVCRRAWPAECRVAEVAEVLGAVEIDGPRRRHQTARSPSERCPSIPADMAGAHHDPSRPGCGGWMRMASLGHRGPLGRTAAGATPAGRTGVGEPTTLDPDVRPMTHAAWTDAVGAALAAIESGALEKVVLSRDRRSPGRPSHPRRRGCGPPGGATARLLRVSGRRRCRCQPGIARRAARCARPQPADGGHGRRHRGRGRVVARPFRQGSTRTPARGRRRGRVPRPLQLPTAIGLGTDDHAARRAFPLRDRHRGAPSGTRPLRRSTSPSPCTRPQRWPASPPNRR